MLEREAFIVRRTRPGRRREAAYEIVDPAGELLGRAVEAVTPWTSWLGRVLGRHALPTRIVLREELDESLLAVLHYGGRLVRPRLEVRDAQGESVGWFMLPGVGGFTIHGREGGEAFHVDRPTLPCRFLTPDRTVELGSASREADRLVVLIRPELADQPLAKLLVLAASLWLGEVS